MRAPTVFESEMLFVCSHNIVLKVTKASLRQGGAEERGGGSSPLM